MSRTRRCAPSVEEGLRSVVVVPNEPYGFLATLTTQPPSGPDRRPPLVVTGEGDTVARAVGAAEAAAWKALNEVHETKAKRPRDRRQVEMDLEAAKPREV
jgi:hypothetical protein